MRRPPCFEDDDWGDWTRLNETTPHGRAKSPCQDCQFDFHIEMRNEGRCDGVPRSVPDDNPRRLEAREQRRVRDRAIAMRQDGASYHAIAKTLGIQASTVWRWCNAED